MRLILEYKEFTAQTKKVDIVKHWLDHYLNKAYENWLNSVEVFDKKTSEADKQIKWEETFWDKFGLPAINSVLTRITYKNDKIDIELDKKNDLFSLIDVDDKDRILFFAKSIFDKNKTKKYENSLEFFKEEFLDKINRNYLLQDFGHSKN